MMEITKMHERLRGNPLFSDPSSCLVLTLHSMLSGEDHAKDRPSRSQVVNSFFFFFWKFQKVLKCCFSDEANHSEEFDDFDRYLDVFQSQPFIVLL